MVAQAFYGSPVVRIHSFFNIDPFLPYTVITSKGEEVTAYGDLRGRTREIGVLCLRA